jgi:hypothetical protein
MTKLERWVLEGARDGRPSFAFFPTQAHTDAFMVAQSRRLIDIRETTLVLTEAGREALSRESAR